MKTLSILFVLVTLAANIIVAQDMNDVPPPMEFSIYGGGSFPQGDFGATTGQKAGFGKTGFCAMLEGSKPLNINSFWTTSVSLSVNSMDDEEMERQAPGFTITAGNYVTTWGMTGFNFDAPISETASIYGIGQIGILFSSFPDITLSYSGLSVTQTTEFAMAFAYGFGAGIRMDKVNIGLRYYSGEPEYEQTASGSGLSGSAKVKLPATLLQLMLGFAL